VKLFFFICLSSWLLIACSSEKKDMNDISQKKATDMQEYCIPLDSIGSPEVVPAGKPIIVKAGKPNTIKTNLNIIEARHPTSIFSRNPKIFTPGEDTLLLPIIITAIDSPFIAGLPEVTMCKEPFIRAGNSGVFNSFSVPQGLKSSFILDILSDKKGNIWLGTSEGIIKFDGKSFTTYSEKQGIPPENRSIMEDSKENIWVTTQNGVSRFDGSVINNYSKRNGLINESVNSIVEVKNGDIWFATDGGVSKYNGKFFSHYTIKQGLINNEVYSLFQDIKANLWIGTSIGVSMFNGKSFVNYGKEEGFIGNNVKSILGDSSGNIWFGTSEGAIKFDGKTFSNYTIKEGLCDNSIRTMHKDFKGNIWFGTSNGATKYDGKYFTSFTVNQGLSNNEIDCITQDKNGNMWLSTVGHYMGALDKFNGDCLKHFSEKDGLTHKTVKSIIQDKNGNLWFGTRGGGVYKYNGVSFAQYSEKQGLLNNLVFSMVQDKDNNIWFGTAGGASRFDGKSFSHYNNETGLSDYIYSLFEDKNKDIWFGSIGDGLIKYDWKNFTHFLGKRRYKNMSIDDIQVICIAEDDLGNILQGSGGGFNKYSLKDVTRFTEYVGQTKFSIVYSILKDNDGLIWIGTDGGGVIRFDGKTFRHYKEKEGLSSNNVKSLLQDKSGNIWFGTDNGLNKLSTIELKKISQNKDYIPFFKTLEFDDGFIGINCNTNAIYEAANGVVWIGANDILAAYDPKIDVDSVPPNIQLTCIKLFNENVEWINLANKKDSVFTLSNGAVVSNYKFDSLTKWYFLPQNLSLAYDNSYLTFNFIGITQSSPKKVKYQYKLEGLDKNWSITTSNTEASYANLPHGTYTFKVKAMNSEGVWSKPFEYTFTIRPPWWKTWWAYSIYFITLVGSVWYYIKWRERALKQRQLELEKTVDQRTYELVEEKKLVEHQKELVEEKQKEILDSIEYAKRIQATILPSVRVVKKYLEDSFILYLPKDIVAGDFYWMESSQFENFKMSQFENEKAGSQASSNQIFFAACDCTGHGVPGAMVSVVCHNALNKALKEFGKRRPADILDKVAELVIDDFNKNAEDNEEIKDGMDASLCALDTDTGKLQWAGANNPLWLIRKGQALEETKADKQPVGRSDERHPYTNHEFQLDKGDVIYLVTDGYADQFGGGKNRKFQKRQLKELLFSLHQLPMDVQRNKLYEAFTNWRGENEQIDDVCIIGVRI
jgi:ligand-binding sensor domain-containing protein/serine phosphatase RsbU (regulator of sigma subunit)